MDYLAYYGQHPLFVKTEHTGSCKYIAKQYKKVRKDWNNHKLCPQDSALEFYLCNHAYSLLKTRKHPYAPLTPVETMIVERYTRASLRIGARLFFYVLLICTRESRHAGIDSGVRDKLIEDHGYECFNFWIDHLDCASSSSAVESFMSSAPAVPVMTYAAFLQSVFLLGGFGTQFGGKAWADIATCLVEYTAGRASLEVFLDTAWTLCHNNGPIFNKGIIFLHHDSGVLTQILDCQRAGCVPQYLHDNQNHYPGELLIFKYAVEDIFPEEFGGSVDWNMVHGLGAVGTHTESSTVVPEPTTKKYQVDHQTWVPMVSREGVPCVA